MSGAVMGFGSEWLAPAGRTGQVLHCTAVWACTAVGACGCASNPQWKCSGLNIGRTFCQADFFLTPVFSWFQFTVWSHRHHATIEESELHHRGGKG